MSRANRRFFLFSLLAIAACNTNPATKSPPVSATTPPPASVTIAPARILAVCKPISFQTASDIQFQADMANALTGALNAAKLPSTNSPSLGVEFAKSVITPSVASGLYTVRDQLFCRARAAAPSSSATLNNMWAIGAEEALGNITIALASSTNAGQQQAKLQQLKVAHANGDLSGSGTMFVDNSGTAWQRYSQYTGTLNFAESTFYSAQIKGIATKFNLCGFYADKVIAEFPPSTFYAMSTIDQAVNQYLAGFVDSKGAAAMIADQVYAAGAEIISKAATQTSVPSNLQCTH